MREKIRYRLAFNRARRLNKDGCGLISIEAQQGKQRACFSTHIYVKPNEWRNRRIVGLPNADDLMYVINTQRMDIERIEMEFVRKRIDVTLAMIKEAVRSNMSPGALLRDYTLKMIDDSQRTPLTKQNYITLLNDIDKYRPRAYISDLTDTFVRGYIVYLGKCKLKRNTIISRLRLLRAIANDARSREYIERDPFARIKIPQSQAKKGFLSQEQLSELEAMKLSGREEIVRDAFLLACYTGLRFSDIRSLRKKHIDGDWIVKDMVKTKLVVEIPYKEIHSGKANAIIEKYGGDIGNLTRRVPSNSTTNAIMHSLFERICADERFTFHTSRHTCASLLCDGGVSDTTIQHILGHTKAETTRIYVERTRESLLCGLRCSPASPEV